MFSIIAIPIPQSQLFYSFYSLYSPIAISKNESMIYMFITLATFLTAIISGLFSMAGGLILIGVMVSFLSVPATMVLHGIAQTFSNGSRVWIYRHHIKWSVLVPYAIGAGLVLTTFISISYVPSTGLIFLIIGTFPFIALKLPQSINLDMQRKPVALICGIIVTSAQMLAGVAGALLDVFYIKSNLTRQEILGTKAVTQTLGHIIKLSYYGVFVGASDLTLWVVPAVIVAALSGNYFASTLVMRMTDHQFKTAGKYLICVFGLMFLGKGIYELWG